MTQRSRLLTALVVFGFVAFLLWTTMASQRAECTVAVAYAGGRGEATASGASEADAVREAQTTACGPLARGMNESIACSNTPPLSRRCRPL